LNTISGLSSNIPSIPKYINYIKPLQIPEAITNIEKLSNNVGTVSTAIGGLTSGVNLGLDIASAVNDKKVSFDNAMNIADDATGIVSSALSFIPGVGVPLSISASIGEKLITGGIKAGKAVKDEKAKNINGETWIDKSGKKHLKGGVWLDTVIRSNAPSWMVDDIGTQIKNYKKDKPKREAQKKQDKEDYKSLSQTEKVKKFFFG
jgi:hypothetical protein